MANLAKLQKKRNTLFLTPKRKLTSVIKPTTVDTTTVAPTAPVTGGSTPVTGGSPIPNTPINTSAGSGTSVISPTITNTPTTGTPAPVTPTAPKTNTITDKLTDAAIIGGATLAGKYIYDKFGNIVKEAISPSTPVVKPPTTTPVVKPPITSVVKPPVTPAVKPPVAPVVKPPVVTPPVAPVVKPPTSVVIPPTLQKEQDDLVKAANTAKEAAAHDALANSFGDQGTKVGLPDNTIPNTANPSGGSTIDESMFDDPLDQGEKLGLEENVIPNYTPPSSGTVDDSMFDFDQGTDVDLDYNTIPDSANPNGGSTIDESMFDDPYGVGLESDVIPSAGSEIGPNGIPYDEDPNYGYTNATADQLDRANQSDDPLGALVVDERYTDIDKNYADQFNPSLPIEFEDVDLDDPNDPLNSFKPDVAVEPVQGGLGQTQADILNTIQDTPVSEPAPLSDTASKIGIFANPVYPEPPAEPLPVATEPSAEPVLVQDESGNFFLANADGSYSPADEGGNAVGEPIFMGGNEDVGTGTEYADSGYGDTALDTAGGGGGYEATDDAGNLYFVGDDGSFTLLEPAPQETAVPDGGSNYLPEAEVNNETPSYEDPSVGYDPSAGYEAYDDAGNLFFVGDDGSFTLLEPAPEVPTYEEPALEEPILEEPIFEEPIPEEPVLEEPVYEDPYAGYDPNAGYEAYDDEGNLYFVGDDGSFTLLMPAYEEPIFEELPPYYEPDLSYLDDYTFENPDFGYDFNYDPSYYEEPPPYIEPDLSYLDDYAYEDPYFGYDFNYDPSYYEEPPAYYESDLSYLDDYKRGGKVQKMKKGGLPRFEYGGGAYNTADDNAFQAESTAIPKNEAAYFASQADYDMGYTPSNPASIADMEYLYSDVDPNNDTSAYYTPVNNDTSAYYTSTNPDMEENVFNPYDLHANEDLVEDPEGRKFAHDNTTGYYRLLEDSKFPTNSSPTTPTPVATPKSGIDFSNIFSADNIKTLAGAGLGAAGLMSLYNSFKDKEPNSYKPAVYTPPAIAPRTTDFGMGPARTVTPQMGGLQTMTPSQQEALYTNLGVAGYEQEHEDPVEDPVADQPMADGGYAQPQQPQSTSPSYFTYGVPQDPLEVLGVRQPQPKSSGGGLQMRQGGLPHPTAGVPIVQGRQDYRQGAAVSGEGDGQSDDIPAMLADGEYVFDSDVVAALGNGSNKAGAEVLDKFRESIRAHKRSAPIGKIPPKAKSPLAYLKEAK
jgi:hypothetical protein